MNIEAYDLESLREIVRLLEYENRLLKNKLKKENIPYEEMNPFEETIENTEEYDLDQGARIVHPAFISEKMAIRFFSMFWGREDVYARRGKNGGYFPQCENRWNDRLCPKQRGEKIFCDACKNKKWTKLDVKKIVAHLLGHKEDGSDVIGVYPLLPDGTCRFIVFDFDNHEKGAEATDFANADSEWHKEVDALRKICEINGIKPLIALPLQGQALKNGNSAFVDENWNTYPNQWDVLLNKTEKLSIGDIEKYIEKWQVQLAEGNGKLTGIDINNRPKPWKKKWEFEKVDVVGKLHLVLSNGVYVDTLNLMPRIQNQIRSLAAFDNPEYYKNKRLGYSNYYNYTAVYLGKDIDGYIQVPRGLRERISEECTKAGIPVEISDQRETGRPIRVSFHGDLQLQQELAAEQLLRYSDGVLEAATAFGKTVVCSYLIAERKVNTLILLQSKDLLSQWSDELNKFLDIREEPPEYETKTGRKKKRDSAVGILRGSKNTLTGIVDIAMVGSVYSKGKFQNLQHSYGMVIVDECHHAASHTYMEVLQKIKAKYVYGVSATPKRGDHLDKIIYMMLGPLRHRFTALEVRNEMIANDVKQSISQNQTPVILTRYKEHAKLLYDMLKEEADHVFLMYGDNSERENAEMRMQLKQVPRTESLILIATGQKIGEGFDFPRLDVLMLAAPVSFEGRLEQYIGRLNRDYEGKEAVYVYDYIDAHMRKFNKMYGKRLRTYKKTGFSIRTGDLRDKQVVHAIFDSGNYTEKFERDLVEAEKSIVISSANIRQERIDRLLSLVKERQENGVSVTVITTDPEKVMYGNADMCYELIREMKQTAINVVIKEEVEERFAVIDDELVWHGGMNLLGKEDAWDNLMRIKNHQVAAELLEIALAIIDSQKE